MEWDRGSQYRALAYQKQLAIRGIRCSISRPGDCWDNAVVESFLARLGVELIYRRFRLDGKPRRPSLRTSKVFTTGVAAIPHWGKTDQ